MQQERKQHQLAFVTKVKKEKLKENNSVEMFQNVVVLIFLALN